MIKTTTFQLKTITLTVMLVCFGVIPAFGQLTITKEAPDSVKPGDELRFRIVYQNNGTTIQNNVVIEDVLPSVDFTYLYSDPVGNFDPLTNKITWTKNEIPELEHLNAGTHVIHVYGRVGKKFIDASHYPDGYYLSNSTSQDFFNAATIKSDQITTPITSNTTKSSSKQKCTVTLNQASGVIKSASNSELFYIVSVTNTGNIWNKWVLSTTQAGNPFQQLTTSFSSLNGIPLNNNSTEWIEPGATSMYLMKLVSPIGTNPSVGTPQDPNKSTVTATPVACGNPVSKEFITEICGGNCPPYQYVSAYKVDVPDPVQSGGNLEYRMIIYNSYGSPVQNITLTETYPLLTTYISSTQPTNNGGAVPHTFTGNNKWTFNNLPAGLTTFNVIVKVNDNVTPNTTIENKIELTTPAYGTAPFLTFIEKTQVVSTHDLWITKTANKTNAVAGDIITYTLNFGNMGNYKGDNVTITDNYDETYMDVIDAAGGTNSNGNIEWTISGDMPIGSSYTKTYQLQIKPGANFPAGTTNIHNMAYIANHQNPLISFDSDYTNNQAGYKVFVVNIPDLKVVKIADKNRVSPNENLTYTITVSNIGDADHTGNYTVKDFLPIGVNYVSSSPSGDYNTSDHSVIWTFSTPLVINDSHTLSLEVSNITEDMGGTDLVNEVTVYSAGMNDKDLDNNEFSLSVPVAINLWYGGVSTDWAVETNWTYGVVPAAGENVVFATTVNHTSAAINDLMLDQDRTIGNLVNESDKALIIPVEKTLIVNGTATMGTADQLILKSLKTKANGALVFAQPHNNAAVEATVEFASISKPSTGNWPRIWQFFGVPVRNKRLFELFGPNVQGSIYGGDPSVNTIIRKYEEYHTDPQSLQEKWQNVAINDILVPFLGYEITQPQAAFDNADTSPYKFRGLLNTDENFSLPLTISQSPVYSRGNYMLANPYAAPIFISNMQAGDFDNLAPTIYIYNTGSRQDWLTNNGAGQAGDLPGTYSAIPINAANTIGKTQIPSMQAFLVKAIADNPPTANFTFRYATVYRNAITTQNEPMRISGVLSEKTIDVTSKQIKPMLTIDVIGENGSDRVYLITAEGTGKSYDAGWDGYKTLSADNVQLYAMDADNRRMQVNTDNDLNDTYIGFRTGGESTYTLKFRFNTEMQGMYESLNIQDLATGFTQQIADSGSVTFASSAGSAEKRFKLTGNRVITGTKPQPENSDIQLTVKPDNIDVRNNTGEELLVTVYDLAGHLMMTNKVPTGMMSIRHDLKPGIYMLEAYAKVSGQKTILKSVINK